jgi:hypothetical protein
MSLTYQPVNSEAVAQVQKILDEAFRACLRHCENVPKTLQQIRRYQPATAELDLPKIQVALERALIPLYELIATTMFRIAPFFCPDTERGFNFYLWPGYHSLITHGRIDYVYKRARVGIGVWGRPGEENSWKIYHVCCNSVWHASLFREFQTARTARVFAPPSMHYWLVGQKPKLSEDPYDILHSVTFGPNQLEEHPSYPEHKSLSLSVGEDCGDSWNWGWRLAEKFNEWQDRVDTREWLFPDRFDTAGEPETDFRDARYVLYSLWLHSAFRPDPPPWLEEAKKIFRRAKLSGMVKCVDRASVHPDGADWGDSATGRPAFVACTVVCLHRLLAHAVLTRPFGSLETQHPKIDDRSLGTVCAISSAVMEPSYISVVRPWIRSIFAMIRNSELTVYADRLVQDQSARARLRGSGFIIHELNAIMKQFSNIRERMDALDAESVTTRRFAWDLIASTVNLAWEEGKLAVLSHADARARVRTVFLKPLQELLSTGKLDKALRFVAHEVYRVSKPDSGAAQGALIPSLEASEHISLSPQQYSRCYLLVAEPIRNCCRYGSSRTMAADWRVFVSGSRFSIHLEQSELNNLPTATTFDILDEFLEETGIGRAKCKWITPNKRLLWRVVVRVS